ncbi:MAG TPA: winged helix-turn-helix domain-containing protein [Steroidobacteraceae bacterium]|nr:winged helix-turn-helix domain-containing protein [Steroidobacteraceae bacterium]
MDRLTTIPLRIGDWRVDPQLGQISRGTQIERLEARTLRLLMYLANRAGETVSIDELLDHVWTGVVVTQDSVYQAITSLRRLLGDDAKQPKYIATVPRLGYRLVASVSPWADDALSLAPPAAATVHVGKRRWPIAVALGLLIVLVAFAGWWSTETPAEKSVAVLPFLDITSQDMNEEYFADGMTEELINRLSKVPGFKVPSPTASFYYKDKQLPVAEIARQLHVTYLLDGSLRQSGDTLRVTARLTRARDGYVIWAENYDRPKADQLQVQDEIATEVARALRDSVR